MLAEKTTDFKRQCNDSFRVDPHCGVVAQLSGSQELLESLIFKPAVLIEQVIGFVELDLVL